MEAKERVNIFNTDGVLFYEIKSIKVFNRSLSDKELTYITGGNYWSYIKNVIRTILWKIKSIYSNNK